MDPAAQRSDSRSRLIPARASEVFAALSDPARVARWWGPEGFTNTIHRFDFRPGGQWLLTMHGPDGKSHPNESRFARIEPDTLWEIEHLTGHHFMLTLGLEERGAHTAVHWRQTFDTADHYRRVAAFVATANAQNLERLADEVARGRAVA